jgi:hypothetical protein
MCLHAIHVAHQVRKAVNQAIWDQCVACSRSKPPSGSAKLSKAAKKKASPGAASASPGAAAGPVLALIYTGREGYAPR